jgi:hypothetical protein
MVNLWPRVAGVEHAGCRPGVPVILTLRGYKTGWAAHCLHRSTPGATVEVEDISTE